MSDQQAKVDIVANGTQASREFDAFGAKVVSVSGVVKGSMSGIHSAAMSLHAQILGLGAAVAGSAFLVGVKNQIDLMDATRKSGQQAGVSAQTFAELAYSAKLADVEAEVLTKGLVKLNNQMFKAASGDADMKALFGTTLNVKVREAGGAIRATDKVLEDIAGRFESMEDGAKKVALASAIFGEKLGPRLIPYLNQGKAGIQALREELRSLKGVMTDEQAAAAEQFNDNMTRAGVASERLKFHIANEAIPTLVEYSNFFVEAAKNVGTLEAAWLTFGKAAARIVGADDVGRAKARYADLSNEAQRLRLVMIGVQNTLDREPGNGGALRYMATLTAKVRELEKAALDASAEVARIASNAPNAGGGRGFVNPAGAVRKSKGDETGDLAVGPKVDDRMQGWEAALDKQKVAHEKMQAEAGTFYQFGKEREAAYWQAILGTLDAGDKQRFAVQKRYYGLLLDLRKGDFDAEQAELLTRIDAAKGNFVEQELLAEMYADRARQRYGQNSKEYQDALKRMQTLYRAHNDALREIDNIRREVSREDQLENIAAMERAAQLERDLGMITQQQLLQILRNGIELRRAIELQAKQAELDAMKGNPNADPVALEKLEAELAAIRRRYRGLADQNAGDQAVEKNKPFEAIFGGSQQVIEQGLQSMVANMKITLRGLGDVVRGIGSIMLQELVTKPIAAWLVGQARMVVMTWLFGKQRVAAEATTAGEVTAINAALSIKKIAMSAYEAAAAAYASIAAIPIIGPILAPVSAGIALAAVASFGKRIFSAEGGFDIPKGMNPMIQAHSAEMVLPQRQADVIRSLGDMFASGQGLAAAGGGAPIQMVATPMPGDFFMIHRAQLIKAFKQAKRNFEI